MAQYTWLPFFTEMHKIIHESYNKNSLAKLANDIFGHIKDENPRHNEIQLEEISPITFIGYFNRKITLDNKIHFCTLAKKAMNIKSVVPKDFDGIPQFNNQNCLCMPFKCDREDYIIDDLWKFSKSVLDNNTDSVLFNNFLTDRYPYIGLAYISYFLFLINPHKFYPHNNKMPIKNYSVNDYDDYASYCCSLKEQFPMLEPYELSYKYDRESENKDSNLDNKNTKNSLNQILYGPPGCGKTYDTVIKAMEIVHPELIQYNKENNVTNYDELKKEFNNLRSQGQIEFITFHQSYSYEEFVEGIKPETKNGQITYKVKDGIFKRFCNEDFKTIFEIFKQKYPISSTLYTASEYEPFKITDYREDSLTVDKVGNLIKYSELEKIFKKDRIKKFTKQQELKNISESDPRTFSYCYAILLELRKLNKPKVFIIDEINRGNISKIFGELITLFEDDKRENLTVTLPYSNEDFTVPKNLYIIGTMNTSDRSIASIDIALRRRFNFVEMMPKSNLVADFGVGFKSIFETLNQRIAILLDRDHKIGHSYFIKDRYKNVGISTLKQIWFDSIIPLLNEYFYNDWEKLNLVIPGFIEKKNIPQELKSECAEEYYYEFKIAENFNDDDFKAALVMLPKKNDD